MNTVEYPIVLERIYPFEMDMNNTNDYESLEIHQARYRFAADHLRGSRVADLACGCGFGTALMAQRHPDKLFTGVDIDPEAIAYAQLHYKSDNLQFICADAMAFAQGKFDTIISLETIEHLCDPQGFIDRLPDLLACDGRIIGSVPITPTCDGNPHHLHDFSQRGFKQLFSRNGFVANEEFRQVQPWVYKDAFSQSEQSSSRSKGVGINVFAYYRKHPLAVFSRIFSLLTNGPCNIYLTAVFARE